MLLNRLLDGTNAPLLEQVVRFAAARHKLIVENIANVDTPGYRHKDLSIEHFQDLLRERVEERRRGGRVRFDDIALDPHHPQAGILFHDRNNRSMEKLASDLAGNGLLHNVAIELLRKQYLSMEMALKERVT
jgi:flagellar basal-body rod protein FlgB